MLAAGSTDCTEESAIDKKEDISNMLKTLSKNKEKQEAQLEAVLGEFKLIKKMCCEIRGSLTDLSSHLLRP